MARPVVYTEYMYLIRLHAEMERSKHETNHTPHNPKTEYLRFSDMGVRNNSRNNGHREL